MIPRQKTTACRIASRRPPDSRLRKYDMVMGIIGKQHGVKMDARPKPKAARRNRIQLCAAAACASETAPVPQGSSALTSVRPGAGAMVARLTAGSMLRFTEPDHLPGTQVLSLQVWKSAAT